MTFSLETREALSALDELLDRGERVPDVWQDLPLELRNWLKATLADGDIQFEQGFAERVHAYLVVYRKEQSEEDEGRGSGRRQGTG